MATSATVFEQTRHRLWLSRVLSLGVLALLVGALWLAANYHATVIKKEEPVSLLLPVQAPPPPPPKEVKPPETASIPQQQTLTPQSAVKDNAVTENADAQEGGDSYNIGSGPGDGLHGSGVPDSFTRGPYAVYMAKIIGRAIEADQDFASKLSKVAIRVWISPAGKISKVSLATSTGSAATDRALESFLRQLPPFGQPPPQSILDTQPVEMTVNLGKSL